MECETSFQRVAGAGRIYARWPVTSALMMYPLKNRRDISDGGAGFAREQFCFAGFPDVVDSLLAMKRMCFDEKICTVEDVIEQCRNDWQDESLRHMCDITGSSETIRRNRTLLPRG